LIYHKSSTDMREIKNSSVQTIITSPPYCMISKWDTMFKQQAGLDENTPIHKNSFIWMSAILNTVWEECYRVLIDGGIAAINVGDSTRSIDREFCCYPNYAQLTMNMWTLGFTPLIPIFWKKISNRPNAFLGSGFQPVNAYVSQDCEYIGIFRKGKNRIFTAEEKIKRKVSSFTKEERDDWFRQVWEGIPGVKGSKISSSWNMTIPYRLMRMYSIIGDTIIDPFCGKTGGIEFNKMCNEWGREFVGYTLP
jgi:modification methylase